MKSATTIGLAAIALGAVVVGFGFWVYQRSFSPFAAEPAATSFHGNETMHEVAIVGQPETPTVLTDALTHDGRPAEAACSTCHTTRSSEINNRGSEDLDAFHQDLVVAHGELSCLSCHNDDNYDTLKLADGRSVPFAQTMQLCAQCHGPQYRDYRNGSHGGMTGYWDLTRGPRVRNACTVCHDAHAPAYPELMPVFPPKDGRGNHDGGEH